MLLRIAWRNLRRNGRRTAILCVAMSLSTALLVAITALDRGMGDDLVDRATSLFVGETEVHAPGFRASRSIYDQVAHPQDVLAAARAHGLDAAPRAIGGGLLSFGNRSTGAGLYGVDPAAERAVDGLAGHLQSGAFLPDVAGHAIVVGSGIARSLGVQVGDEIVVVVQAADGSIGDELFRLAGVLSPIGEDVDRQVALVDRRDFAPLFVLQDPVHEIAVTSHGRVPSEDVVAALSPAAGGDEVASWQELLPVVAEFSKLMDGVSWMMSAVFLCAAGLGVLNSMLMAQFERIPEFGLVKALGAAPKRIVGEVMAESLLAGVASIGAGLAIGVLVSVFLQRHGIDLGSTGAFTAGGFAISSVWRAHLTVEALILPAVTTAATALAGALYPALKAARLDPVDALSHV